MKASDFVAQFLNTKVGFVFGLQGGAVVHLFDSCERIGPKPIYCHHEQAAGFAASAYARTHGYGACIVTTGPGATNALTPLLGAWQDSIPMMFISGQVRVAQSPYGTDERVTGMQSAPICNIVAPITKIALYMNDAMAIRNGIAWAYEQSTQMRTGPVWIDIPLDLQWQEV